jgi:hypothetical protein
MTKLSNLWWVGAVALFAACSPYDDTNSAPPNVLSVFVTIGDDGEASESVPATLDTGTGAWTIDDVVPAGESVITVKFNKTLDGASIQTTPTSCEPAVGVNLIVNGVPAGTDWHTCYSPGSGTPSEGSSVVIYQGEDIEAGVGGVGYFAQADQVPGIYAISLTVKDKQGREAPIAVNVAVKFAAPEITLVTPASARVSWPESPGATSYEVERAPNVVNDNGTDTDATDDFDEPGTWAPLATGLLPGTISFDDSGLDAETKYWYRIIFRGAQDMTGDTVQILTAQVPGALTFTDVAATSLKITFDQVASEVSGYIIERTETPATPASWKVVSRPAAKAPELEGGPLPQITVTDSTVAAEKTYYYRLKARGTGWETAPGPEANVTTPAAPPPP